MKIQHSNVEGWHWNEFGCRFGYLKHIEKFQQISHNIDVFSDNFEHI